VPGWNLQITGCHLDSSSTDNPTWYCLTVRILFFASLLIVVTLPSLSPRRFSFLLNLELENIGKPFDFEGKYVENTFTFH
jgi:hypothetical protein